MSPRIKIGILLCIFCLLLAVSVSAQKTSKEDSTGKPVVDPVVSKKAADTVKKYNPNIAIRRSAILPGWGQATNKKYWKIPLVYGALGTTAYLFFRNYNQYQDAKEAYILATDNNPANDDQIKQPYYNVKDQPDRIRVFRNDVRQNMDYCVLFFLGFWGLNVVDAAVDAHLKTFDVTDQLSFGIKAGYSPIANTNGVSLILDLHSRAPKTSR